MIFTSADGRISYLVGADGPVIDGRRAWRGHYADPTTGRATAEAVAPADWAEACQLMERGDATRSREDERLRQTAEAMRGDEIEAAERTEAWLRANTRGTYVDDL